MFFNVKRAPLFNDGHFDVVSPLYRYYFFVLAINKKSLGDALGACKYSALGQTSPAPNLTPIDDSFPNQCLLLLMQNENIPNLFVVSQNPRFYHFVIRNQMFRNTK